MNKQTANKLWGDLYFSIAPLCFDIVNNGKDYSVVFKPTKEKVLTYDDGVKLCMKHNLLKPKNGKN